MFLESVNEISNEYKTWMIGKRLQTFELWYYGRMLKISWRDKLTTDKTHNWQRERVYG